METSNASPGDNLPGLGVGGFRVEEATIAEVHEAIRAGTTTCAELVELHLERIRRYDLDVTMGPPINAFTVLNPQVREEARALDETFRKTGTLSGPLHCVPMVVKDVFFTKGMPTTWGTLALADSRSPEDGFPVRRLREAGAMILGKTAIDEFTEEVWGISSRSGRVANAYDRWENPGGSSSGTAAAVAASFAVAGIGTDSCGSIIIPSAFHGLVGIRGSVGLITQGGGIPCSPLDGVAGPMTRSVTDLAVLLDVLAGPDPEDPFTLDVEARRPESYTASLNARGLGGKRIGVLRGYAERVTFRDEIATDVQALYSRLFGDLESLGATVVHGIVVPDFDTNRDHSYPGSHRNVDRYLAATEGSIRSYVDLCRSAESLRGPRTEAECRKTLEQDIASEGEMREKGLARFHHNRAAIERLMDEQRLDALVFPVQRTGPASYDYQGSCWFTALSGLPSITVPIGFVNRRAGMPVGIEFVGRKWSEPTLIEIASAYEQATRHRRPPVLPPAKDSGRMAPLDLEAASSVRLAIGRSAFESTIGRKGEPSDVTAKRFWQLVRRELSPH